MNEPVPSASSDFQLTHWFHLPSFSSLGRGREVFESIKIRVMRYVRILLDSSAFVRYYRHRHRNLGALYIYIYIYTHTYTYIYIIYIYIKCQVKSVHYISELMVRCS